MEQEKNKRHNGIISFWKFMFSLLVVFKHSANMASNTDNILFLYGSIAVDFFFVISGYFMTKSALKNNTDKNTIGKDTIIYIIKKVKSLFSIYINIIYYSVNGKKLDNAS